MHKRRQPNTIQGLSIYPDIFIFPLRTDESDKGVCFLGQYEYGDPSNERVRTDYSRLYASRK
jgi:hypothetical protein